jgi:hypothetical protein
VVRATERPALESGLRNEMKAALNILSAIFAAIAAVLWWLSSRVKAPAEFPIQVISKNTLAEQIIGSEVLSTGSSAELDDLGKAFIKQSRLSSWAAVGAGVSALLQAAANVTP